MHVALVGLLWVASLALALYASHKLVAYLTALGAALRFTPGLLGLVVALGADAPEVTSALIALSRGATDIGLGVVVGSNVYNLAGLLGLAAILARRVSTGPDLISLDRAANVLLTLMLVALIALPVLHTLLGVALLVVVALYTGVEAVGPSRLYRRIRPVPGAHPGDTAPGPVMESRRALRSSLILSVASVAGIVLGSDLLVNASIELGPSLGVPTAVIGTFVLPIATSLPNTWAAVVLARRHMAEAAIAATFNSNSINAAIGAGLPALLLQVNASHATRVLDVPWLLGMTAVSVALTASRHALCRLEGTVLISLYGLFVVLRLTLFG